MLPLIPRRLLAECPDHWRRGLIGGEVAARLLAPGHRVTALVYRQRSVRANDGTAVEGVEIIPGDVAAPRFNWGEVFFAEMAARHDLLVHCAAMTRFDLDEEGYRAVNIEGLGMQSASRKPLTA